MDYTTENFGSERSRAEAAVRVLRCLLLVCAVALGAGSAGAAETSSASGADSLEFFERRVRPVLADRCYKCHSADSEKLRGELRVDSREALLKGGDSGPSLVPGSPEKSKLIEAIRYENRDLQMPPKGRLSPDQVADLTAWVKMGAPWPAGAETKGKGPTLAKFDLKARAQSHWVWKPIGNPPPPPVKDSAWARSPIDQFLLAKLEQAGLRPAPQADRRTLLRRVSFDLIGLPPTSAEIEAFVNDPSDRAFENVVDRLLASARFGERWGRHWLDIMRYAETYGHEFDYPILGAWRYRDYVIRAFNRDLPYDQFVMEQIAGDLLPNPRIDPDAGWKESVIATGWYWLGQSVHSPVDVRNNQIDLLENQIDVLSKGFMGMTLACARCHDHKFDAISTRDFYSLYGVMESSHHAQRAVRAIPGIDKTRATLLSLKSQIRETLGRGLANGQFDTAKMLLASREVLQGERKSSDAESAGEADILFEDFEKPSYEGWTVTGTAFGSGPQTQATIGAYQGDVMAVGRGFVNSHNIRGSEDMAKGDAHVGKMVSRKFEITRPYIHFLIGGGPHKGKTCLNLLVDGKVVRTATGKSENRMRPGLFETQDLVGKTAELELVDNETGGWGNIGLDHIVFSLRREYFDGQNAPLGHHRPVTAVAAEFQINPAELGKWVKFLQGLKGSDTAHPFFPFRELALRPDANDPALFAKAKAGLLGGLRTSQAAVDTNTVLFADFGGGTTCGWAPDGEAFANASVPAGAFLVGSGDSPVHSMLPRPASHGGAVSSRLQGALRSPDFTIRHGFLHLLVAGQKGRVNLVIDSFNMIRAPIYGGVKLRIDHDTPQWRTMDMSMWKGHRAYIEVVDYIGHDMGDDRGVGGYGNGGYVALEKVCFSDQGAPPRSALPEFAAFLDNPKIGSVGELASAYSKLLSETSRLWSGGDAGCSAFGIQLMDSLLRAGLVPLPPAEAATLASLAKRHKELEEKEIPDIETMAAMVDGTPWNEKVFIRGSHRNLGEEAPRRYLEALEDLTPFKQGSGRLELAQKLVDPKNPLVARARVNWVWHHLFGRGIVPTVDNLGVLGERPTHPELLDWLARSFQTNGWSMKKLIREIALSRAYQMDAKALDPLAEEKDPGNTLLHRMNVKRLEGETIRDSILSASGQLKNEMYGPPVQIHLTPFMDGRGRPGGSGPLDGAGRRSIYVEVRRNFLSPMFLAFDTPIPATTVGRRSLSNVPAQALILMNDPFVVGQAETWANELLRDPSAAPEARIARIYTTAFGRPPDAAEVDRARQFLVSQAQSYESAGEKVAETRLWADLCHVAFNLKEFIFIN